jgi:hypothetical protein
MSEETPPKPNATEKRAVTDAAAQAILDQESSERAVKTKRLRALRLARAVNPPDHNTSKSK